MARTGADAAPARLSPGAAGRALTVGLALLWLAPGSAHDAATRAASRQSPPLRLELFVMSLCPYGMEAERYLIPALQALGDRADLRVYYIADEAAAGADTAALPPLLGNEAPPTPARPGRGCSGSSGAATGSGPFRSLHGQEEVDEGRRQVVLQEDGPTAFRAYLLCRSRQGAPADWRECARAVGVDPQTLEQRAQGPEGESLFRATIRHTNQARVQESPTLLVNGKEYEGEYAGFAVVRRLCREIPADSACARVPVCGADTDCRAAAGTVALCEDPDSPTARCVAHRVVPFTLTVLEAAACASCSTAAFLRTTTELFPGARVEVRRSDTPEGEALARAHGIEAFPAYLFGPGFARSPRFGRVRPMLMPTDGSYLVVARIAPVSYWPRRDALPGRTELFVPAAESTAASRVLDGWAGRPDQLRVHPLPPPAQQAAAQGPLPEEWQRLACLGARQPEAYGPYLRARARLSAQGTSDWESWARTAGADTEALRQCVASGEGSELLGQGQSAADSLQLERDSVSALLDNRLLVRRTFASQLAAVAKEVGHQP